MGFAQSYVESIEALSNEKSSSKRRELLNALTDIFLVSQDAQDEADTHLFSDVMERIAFELEVEARAVLSNKIGDAEKVSHKLIVRLANDDIVVAKPVLERSKILDDDDLLNIIRNRSQDHMHSIAGRETVSQCVSGELVDRGNDRTVTRLTGNMGADISEKSFNVIADRAQENPDLRAALGSRKDLPAAVLEKIKEKVTDRVKESLGSSHPELDDNFLGGLVSRCAEEIKLDCSRESITELERMHAAGGLAEDFVAKLAREGKIADVVHCLALQTGLDHGPISQILVRAELPALAILCKSCGFRGATFMALAETRMGDGNLQSAALVKAMRDYNNLSMQSAERIMRFLKVRLKVNQEREGGA